VRNSGTPTSSHTRQSVTVLFPPVSRQTAVFTIPAKVPVYLANHWVIDVGGRRWEALKLAGQAVVDWDD